MQCNGLGYDEVKLFLIYCLVKVIFCIFSDLNPPEHANLKELEITDIASQTDSSIFNQKDSSNQTDQDHLKDQTSCNQKDEGVQCDYIIQEKYEKCCQTEKFRLIDKSISTDLPQKEIHSDTNCKSTKFKAKNLIDDVIGDIIVDVVNRNEASKEMNTQSENNADDMPSKERSLEH